MVSGNESHLGKSAVQVFSCTPVSTIVLTSPRHKLQCPKRFVLRLAQAESILLERHSNTKVVAILNKLTLSSVRAEKLVANLTTISY